MNVWQAKPNPPNIEAYITSTSTETGILGNKYDYFQFNGHSDCETHTPLLYKFYIFDSLFETLNNGITIDLNDGVISIPKPNPYE